MGLGFTFDLRPDDEVSRIFQVRNVRNAIAEGCERETQVRTRVFSSLLLGWDGAFHYKLTRRGSYGSQSSHTYQSPGLSAVFVSSKCTLGTRADVDGTAHVRVPLAARNVLYGIPG